MKATIVVLLLLAGVYCQYYTNSDRTEGVDTLCVSFSDREELVDAEAEADAESYKSVLKNQLTADG